MGLSGAVGRRRVRGPRREAQRNVGARETDRDKATVSHTQATQGSEDARGAAGPHDTDTRTSGPRESSRCTERRKGGGQVRGEEDRRRGLGGAGFPPLGARGH